MSAFRRSFTVGSCNTLGTEGPLLRYLMYLRTCRVCNMYLCSDTVMHCADGFDFGGYPKSFIITTLATGLDLRGRRALIRQFWNDAAIASRGCTGACALPACGIAWAHSSRHPGAHRVPFYSAATAVLANTAFGHLRSAECHHLKTSMHQPMRHGMEMCGLRLISLILRSMYTVHVISRGDRPHHFPLRLRMAKDMAVRGLFSWGVVITHS